MTVDYPVIEIKDCSNGGAKSRPARQITKHLAVGTSHVKYDRSSYKVFSIQGQRPAISHRIQTFEDAVCIAIHLEHIYVDFWEIHDEEEWRCVDVPMVSRLSVPVGIRTFVAFSSLSDRNTISYNELRTEIDKAPTHEKS